ncbi:MAG: hypothetical protein LBQ69_01095 [Treponema sp.]|jgi:hypothetical protein|nr:hypothetical protein [Treponema sp.]
MGNEVRLPGTVGGQTIIVCPVCGKRYQITYHGKAGENDTYDHKCDCGHVLFTETDGEGYSKKEATEPTN